MITSMSGQTSRTTSSRDEIAGSPAERLDSVIRRWPSQKARDWSRHTVEFLCAHPSILAVVAIGSAVRAADSSHDVDFLVIFREEFPHLGPLPLDVDLRAYAADSLEEKIAAGHDLIGWALIFGIPLCDRRDFWRKLHNSWHGKVPLPSAEDALKRAERALRLRDDLRAAGDIEAASEQHVTWLTQAARASLINAGIHPASRPELPEQLRSIHHFSEAAELQAVLEERRRSLSF